jgi:hypothetical protein
VSIDPHGCHFHLGRITSSWRGAPTSIERSLLPCLEQPCDPRDKTSWTSPGGWAMCPGRPPCLPGEDQETASREPMDHLDKARSSGWWSSWSVLAGRQDRGGSSPGSPRESQDFTEGNCAISPWDPRSSSWSRHQGDKCKYACRRVQALMANGSPIRFASIASIVRQMRDSGSPNEGAMVCQRGYVP